MGIKTLTCRLNFNQAAIIYMLNRKCISYQTLKGNIKIEDQISSKFPFVNFFLVKILNECHENVNVRSYLCKLLGIEKIKKDKKRQSNTV